MMNFSQEYSQKLEKYLWVKKEPWEYEKKLWEKVERYNALFQNIPWVSCICICNSLAMNACHKDSDIDLFVITKSNRIWTARIFLTLALSILWERKTSKQHAWKFCLSFFISEDDLSLEKIAIEQDVYLSYWIQTLRPILNREWVFESFVETNAASFSSGRERIQDRDVMWETSWLKNFFWNLLESLLKSLFLPRTKKSFQKLGKPFWVEISDTILKFHNTDRRKEIRDKIFN